MATRKLRAVAPNEKAPAPKPLPATMEAATATDRVTFLKRSLVAVARQIDAGPPAHALARLIVECDRLDREVRLLELAAAKEQADGNVAKDEAFNISAV